MPFRFNLNKVRAGKVGAIFALLLLPGSWLPKLSKGCILLFDAKGRKKMHGLKRSLDQMSTKIYGNKIMV